MKINNLWPICVLTVLVGCSEVNTPVLECTTGDRQCADKGAKVQVCLNGYWVDAETCSSGTLCNNQTTTCVSTATVCTDGEKLCNSNILMECRSGFYVKDIECESNEWCNPQTNSCMPRSENTECETNEVKCESNNLYQCSGNAWVMKQSCPATTQCNAASSSCEKTIECSGSEKKCDSDFSRVLTCTNGFWKPTELCDSDSECNTSTLTCQKGCEENVTKCDVIHHTLMKCTGGTWQIAEDCAKADQVCNAQTNACEAKPECVTGTLSCANDTTKKTCTNGHWDTERKCLDNEKCIAGECISTCSDGNCEPSTCEEGAVCEDNVLVVCSNGTTFKKICEPYQVCNATTQTCDAKPECTLGSYKCSGFELQICSVDGKWTSYKKCVGNEVCDETQHACIDTSECKSGEAYCDTNSNKLMSCSTNGQWQESKVCQSTEVCNASNKSCDLKPVCTSGEYQCNGLELQKCTSAGQWSKEKQCSNTQTCDKSLKKCLDCTPNTYECNDQTLKKCNAGVWETAASCTDTQTCSADKKKCLDCTGNGYQCNGQKLQQCNNNTWKDVKTCSASEICDASQKSCINNSECTDGKFSCLDKVLRECSGGKWTTKTTCKDTENCNSEKKSCVLKPVCDPGKKQCNDNNVQTCSSEGQWESTPCGDNALCVADTDNVSCVDKMTLPTWCKIEGIDNKRRGYGRVLMPTEVEIVDISASFVCGQATNPVMSWSYSADAVYNKSCTNCFANTEFMSYSLEAPSGEYSCTYRFDFGPESFVCTKSGSTPVMLDSSTKISKDDAMTLTVQPVSSFTPSWCYFKHFDESAKMAYGRIFLGDSEVPANVDAKLICGDINQPVPFWDVISDSKENLFCDNCGNNVEFMVDAKTLSTGSHFCAFRFDVGGKAYVCPTYRDDYGINTGGTPIELNSSEKMLNSMNVQYNSDPVTVWEVNIK